MSTASIGTVLDAVRAGLVLRAGLAGVNVYSGDVSLEEAGLECIAFMGAKLAEEPAGMGGSRKETWTLEGATQALKPWQGTTEETIKAARDRALALFAELEAYLNDTYTGTLPSAEITAGELTQGYNTEGRWCAVGFTVTIEQIKNP